MRCQRCQDQASVHLAEMVDGKLQDTHLCEACARKAGVPIGKPQPLGLENVLDGLIQSHVGELLSALARTTCPDCSLKFMEFRVQGRFGCPGDYSAFQAGLLPLLHRMHGATRHVGKMPSRFNRTPSPKLRLRAQLRQAVALEQYELAARLRDQLRQEESEE